MFRPVFTIVISYCLIDIISSSVLQEELKIVDDDLRKLNAVNAEIQWKLATTGSPVLSNISAAVNKVRMEWKLNKCAILHELIEIFAITNTSTLRAIRLLCNGPIYSASEVSKVTDIQYKLRSIYQNTRINVNGQLMGIEPDLSNFMAESRDPWQLYTVWMQWREAVGPQSRELYRSLVQHMNRAARRNGYRNIGECWKEELEINNLEEASLKLYQQLRPLYEEIHAVVRYRLRAFYGAKHVSSRGPIPAHLLGNMWGQSWVNIIDIVYESAPEPTLTELLKQKNYTVLDMAHKAEDMYTSLGFPPMNDKFWEKSSFVQTKATCHGTAANMFHGDDYRILMCPAITEEDFHVIHHEMGHIEYFMAYKDLPTIFQDGANSAVHEGIGETIMMASSTPSHLERLSLVPKNNGETDRDTKYLLKLALKLLPQIPFALAVDMWRWHVFSGDIQSNHYNAEWWNIRTKLQGLTSPTPRSAFYFDPASKFHIMDNTPYIRYFLASILQFQLFEAMCKGAVFQNSYVDSDVPFPLHKCDIYGSRHAAVTLRFMMAKGRTINWDEAVRIATGSPIQIRSLLRFFQPLRNWLSRQIKEHKIPVGWTSDK